MTTQYSDDEIMEILGKAKALAQREIWLLTIYAKGDRSTIPAHELRLIKETIDDD